MNITFRKKYTDSSGKVFPKGQSRDIFRPVAMKLISEGIAEASPQKEIPMREMSRPSKILDAKGNKMEVVSKVPELPASDEEASRPKGKDS